MEILLSAQLSTKHLLKQEISRAHKGFIHAFNKHNANKCASFYDSMAIVQYEHNQFIIGRYDIEEFWQDILVPNIQAKFILQKTLSVNKDFISNFSRWQLNNGRALELKNTWTINENSTAAIVQQTLYTL
ncbi:hypothetical protein [Alteromonas sp. P256]|uniref:hypothetical protein n=1 Tax=Alteromonas sp. P256 TaxID=3117399 RepID=UPI002FDF5FFC